MKQTAVMQVMSDIKEYVNSLNVSDNTIYQENEILILSCFTKAMEICESKLEMEKEQIERAYNQGVVNEVSIYYTPEAEQYYKQTYK
jgi:hypothetical protein